VSGTAQQSKSGRKASGSDRSAATTGKGTKARREDPKRTAREQRLRRQRRALRLRIALVALGLIGLIAGAVALYNSNTFAIEEVQVEGLTELTAEEVIAVAALPEGATLIRFPRAEMEVRLLAHPWISSAHIGRRFPDALVIHLEERKPVALVDTGEAAFWLVDSQSTVLGQRTPDATETAAAVVRDLTDFEPVEGERSESAALENALRVIEGLSDELRARVRAVSAPSVDLTTLITVDDIEILVGSAEDIEKKDAVALRIMEEQADTVVHINVRTVDRPTWRGLDSAQ
jgi:cell division protein FtsQ